MAQTSNRARSRPSGSRRATGPKRSNSSGSKTRSSASRSSNERSSKRRATSRNASGSGRKTSASTRARSSPRSKAKSPQKRKTTQASRSTGRAGQSTVVKVAQKARGPALAGGAALLGLAGGMALNSRRKRNGVLSSIGSKLNLPQPNLAKRLPTPNGSALNLLGEAATEVARGSSKVQELASQVQKAAETISPESSSDE
jgi:hypothetical protein